MNNQQTLSDVLQTSVAVPLDPTLPTIKILIDGDLIAFRAAAVTDGRTYRIIGIDSLTWDYKQEAVNYCDANDISVTMIELAYYPEDVSYALQVVKHLMNGIKSNLAGKFPKYRLEFITYLTEKGNFRNSINPGYKSGRKGVHRPTHLQAAKDFMKNTYGATATYGLEADDLLTLEGSKLPVGEFVICSIDKDLRQLPGLHYDFVNDSLTSVSYEEAQKNLWGQVISGDTTDSIFSPYGLGKKTGEKLYGSIDWSTVELEDLLTIATQAYCSKMKKTLDHVDVRCWVLQTLDQVYLLRTAEEKEAALKLMESKEDE